LVVALFREHGFQVELNRPYSGAFVPMPCYRINAAVWSVMIEINRALYMNEASGTRHQQYEELRPKVQVILQSLVDGTRKAITQSQQ